MGIHVGGPTTEIRANGSELLAPNNAESWGIADQVWRWKVYTKHFPILEGYRVLDVGAHYGFFSVFAARQNREVKVVSYEPSKSTFEILRRNLDHNVRKENSFAFNVALSDRTGSSVFFKPEAHDASGTLFKENLAPTASPFIEERVRLEEANRIWDVFEAYDFAKMDCEGSEFPILRCLGERVKRLHYIVLEYHHSPHEIVEFLLSQDFSIVEMLALDAGAPWHGLSQLGMLYAKNNRFLESTACD
jgi:FkbM family methyltransferase